MMCCYNKLYNRWYNRWYKNGCVVIIDGIERDVLL